MACLPYAKKFKKIANFTRRFLKKSYTTLLTCDYSRVSICPSPCFQHLVCGRSGDTYFEEPLQPPDLEDALPNQDSQLKYAPPLDPSVRALSSVAVGAFADNDV